MNLVPTTGAHASASYSLHPNVMSIHRSRESGSVPSSCIGISQGSSGIVDAAAIGCDSIYAAALFSLLFSSISNCTSVGIVVVVRR